MKQMNKQELKFRGWDGEMKRMVFWTLNDLLVRFNTSDYTGDDKPSPFFCWTQYTGLQDKNGKEIYEGDVMETKSYVGEVVWGISGWVFVGENIYTGTSEMLHKVNDDSEIIGNIYENPELIK